MELLDWKHSLSLEMPDHSEAKPKKMRFSVGKLNFPSNMTASGIYGLPMSRAQSNGAVSIEVALLTAERASFSALGVLFIAYALSDQKEPFRLKLAGPADALSELTIWPSKDSAFEKNLGLRQRLTEVFYRPKLPPGNPNYTTDELYDPEYPREHLPYCRLGNPDVEGGGFQDKKEPVCVHFQGTSPSLVWLGKYLLDFGLSDNNATLAYLYNLPPIENMAVLSGELRLTVANTGKAELGPHV